MPTDESSRPTVAQVAERITRLGGTAKSVEQIADAYAAEVTAQARVCRIDPYGADLAAALVRRVHRHINMAALPLGVSLDENAVRVGTNDPEVRRLEGPYRKVIFG